MAAVIRLGARLICQHATAAQLRTGPTSPSGKGSCSLQSDSKVARNINNAVQVGVRTFRILHLSHGAVEIEL